MTTRKELQSEAIETLMRDRRLIVEWGTGVGKSRVGVEVVRRTAGRDSRILLLVNETAHKKTWRDEFIKSLGDEGGDIFDAAVVECYASLGKYEGTSWDLIIMDEGHHMRSELKTGLLSTLTAERVLVLSATLSENGDGDALVRTLEETFGPFRRLAFGVQKAIDNNILGRPVVYVHRIPLDLVKGLQHVTFEWGVKAKRKEIHCSLSEFEKYASDTANYPAASLVMSCTAREGYDFLTEKIDEYRKRYKRARESHNLSPGDPDNRATMRIYNRLVQFGSRRKLFLGRCKTAFTRWLLARPELDGRKYVCFCSDVDQGEALGGKNIISARRKDCGDVIDAFNRDEIRSIFAVGMIQEGANLNGIEAGVIVQLGGKERVFVQKFGRALRAKSPIQHIVVADGTRDEYYYSTAVRNIDRKYIKEINWGKRMGYSGRSPGQPPVRCEGGSPQGDAGRKVQP